ncbi:metallophosphoesterase [Paracoccus aestuarii]|uniref:Metallophosphoesterase n=1 Tax=Paracoccus aestuarii TaxID=453842 RepID=A0A418ZYN9_9RHOB|nr:metallophosphoesterase [Paracoccus aestuarii]RJL05626.1 metallophosphoesterase [Paracoccus aestuarii]WCQ97926.1 metallophosphoesterase [Paracoccus aestuarii]
MARILHLTDLHFGFHRSALEAPLLARIAALRPDLVVVGGDITHRATPGQMRSARAFLDRIEAPMMLMPGNHDVPTWNPVARIFWPFAGFQRHFGPDLTPAARVGDVRVMALNSADPYVWQRGKIRDGEIGRVIGTIDPMGTNIVALHHPLQHLPRVDKVLARRATEALYRLEGAGVHVVLTGHLHRWAVDALLATGRHPRVLQVQTGTALCARVSDMRNEFVLLDIRGTELSLERHVAPMDREGFDAPEISRYSRASGVWRRV